MAYKTKVSWYSYHSVNVITFSLAQSDHNKWRLLYDKFRKIKLKYIYLYKMLVL